MSPVLRQRISTLLGSSVSRYLKSNYNAYERFGRSISTTSYLSRAEAVADKPVRHVKLDVLPTSNDCEELLKIRHSTAHILAMAVQRLYKGTQVTIGPWTEKGFFYDFDFKVPVSEKELKDIKKEMDKLIKANLPFVREEVSAEEARRRIDLAQEPYKLEILEGILKRDPNAIITIYHIGDPSSSSSSSSSSCLSPSSSPPSSRSSAADVTGGAAATQAEPGNPAKASKTPRTLPLWWDLCAGPHVERTGDIDPKAVELDGVAGAYWRGDVNRPMLTRISGTAWRSKDELEAYRLWRAEAARRDHRKLGQDLDLFSIHDEAGGGLVYWHPNGALIRHLIESFWKEKHLAHGYRLVNTPHIAKVDLWQTSGHLDFYRESMFDTIGVEDERYQLKPMNCPFHIGVFKHLPRSYRELPYRMAELGTVYRYEARGALHGLFRVRGFTQDDGHIFCLPEQIASEISHVLEMVEEVLGTFGFRDYEVNLSTRPEKSVGDDEIWERSEAALREALNHKQWKFEVDEGGGAFYGPKIDIKVRDAIGRKWQCSTVQLDFNLPERFDMSYVDEQNTPRRPIMIHRAIFGSLERFFGIMIEETCGAFPLWLAPLQARVIVVSDQYRPYADRVAAAMRSAGVRVDVQGQLSVAKLMRNAQVAKVPVVCVVGAKEAEAESVSVRLYGGSAAAAGAAADGDLGAMSVADVIAGITEANRSKGSFPISEAVAAAMAARANSDNNNNNSSNNSSSANNKK